MCNNHDDDGDSIVAKVDSAYVIFSLISNESCICNQSIEAERKSWWCLHTPNDTEKYQNKQINNCFKKHLPIIKCQWIEREQKITLFQIGQCIPIQKETQFNSINK